LRYGFNPRNDRYELVLQSRRGGRHSATHASVELLDDNGALAEIAPITPDIADFIFETFDQRGDTEAFSIFRSDLAAGHLLPRHAREIEPGEVRHRLTPAEKNWTATGAKLAHHWPLFQKYGETGYGSIVRATMTLHQVCSSRCPYCSTIARNKADRISLEEAQAFVTALYDDQAHFNRERFPDYNERYKTLTGSDIRLRGLILSGGGQPNLWPHFSTFVAWLAERDIDLGLITNGFPRFIDEDVYRRFRWVRISITPEDASPHYLQNRFDLQPIPQSLRHNKDITVGYSHVYGPWTTDDLLLRIVESLDDNGFDYCRLLTDCTLSRDAQIRAHDVLAETLFRLNLIEADGTPRHRLFHQMKYHGTADEGRSLWDEGQCFLQTYNVFWDTTGHQDNGHSSCYACDSVTVLTEVEQDGAIAPAERRFDASRWGTVPNTEVQRLYTEPVRAFFDPRKICASCLFMRNNREVKNLAHTKDYDALRLDDSIDHVNFP